MDIETIYRLYFRDVCLFLQGLTRSEALAEELTQETFFRAPVSYTHLDVYKRQGCASCFCGRARTPKRRVP